MKPKEQHECCGRREEMGKLEIDSLRVTGCFNCKIAAKRCDKCECYDKCDSHGDRKKAWNSVIIDSPYVRRGGTREEDSDC